MERRLAAIMFTDIAGYTSLSQTDEPAALRLIQAQDRLVRGLLEIYRGRLVKSMGDGLLIEFGNALDAVMFADDLQRHIRERNARDPPPELRVRVGIHLGDVQESGSDIFGDAVNVASRVQSLAEPGGICLTEAVFGQVQNKVPFELESQGPRTLKGVQEPVSVYRVVLPAVGAITHAPPKLSGPPRLAVLPLTNISHDPENEYFADGLTEELIAVLSQIKGLRVISRTSASQYKGSHKPLAQIGSELGADSVLEGSVRKAGDRLRITVQLIDTRTDEHRWAETYDRQLENVFAIQAEVAERTANALRVELVRSERKAIQDRPTSNLAAYEAYLKGLQASQRSFAALSPEIDREAVSHFEEAIREDPTFVEAYSRLATHLIFMMGETRLSKDVVPTARALIRTAEQLDPNSSDLHLAEGELAVQVDHDWARAEVEFQRAIALNPSNAEARVRYGELLAVLQRFGEAETQFLAAIEQDPLNVRPRADLASALVSRGDVDSAIALSEKLVREFPQNAPVRGQLAGLYVIAGRADDAVGAVAPLAAATDWGSRFSHAAIHALLGKTEQGRAFLADLRNGRTPELAAVWVALLWAALGEREKALDLFERDERDGVGALWAVYRDITLDEIRDDPRFIALLRRAKLPTTLVRPRLVRRRYEPA
jgi:TolB-like protein/class 3 adenylate cyclase/Flp pilus assembly protein TadD